MAVLLLLVSIAATAGFVVSYRGELDRIVVIAIALIAVDYVGRAAILLTGLDSPFPDVHFFGRELGDAHVRAQAVFLIWIGLFTCSAKMVERLRFPRWFSTPILPSNDTLAWYLPALTILAVVASAVVWQEYGVSDLGAIAKRREVNLPRALRNPSVIVAYLGVATATVGVWQRRSWLIVVGVMGYLVGAAVSFTWGARDAAVFPLLLIPLAAVDRARRSGQLNRRTFIQRAPLVLAGFVLVVAIGVGLRAAREVIAFGGTLDRTTEGSFIRDVAVTSNTTAYDALLLVTDDQDPTPESPGLGIFAEATRVAAVGQPQGEVFQVPAVRVARTFEPRRANGWPITTPGEWYFAQGFLGVALGAVLSGALYQLIDSWRRGQPESTWAAAFTLTFFWLFTVASSGIGVATVTRSRTLMGAAIILLVGGYVLERVTTRVRGRVVSPPNDDPVSPT
ncbi:MAG: hypothetical protein AAF467_26775 [Actinomycetota bacterium]